MGRVGRYVQLKAREGQRDALVEHMLGAAQLLAEVPGCELYVINTSATDADAVSQRGPGPMGCRAGVPTLGFREASG